MGRMKNKEKNTLPNISVIIPVYQAEKYIAKCINSVLQQTYRDFEIILVDDGSTDRSIDIAKTCLVKSELPFCILQQKNSGASAARNAGVKVAKGRYLIFVDADDYLKKNYLKSLLQAVTDTSLDVSIANFKYVSETDISSDSEIISNPVVIKRDELLRLFLVRKINIAVTAILIKRNIFIKNNLWFDESVRFGEDAIFYWRLIISQENVVYNYTPLYNYCLHPGSTTTAPTKDKIHGNVQAFIKLKMDIEQTIGREFADFVVARQFFSIIRIYSVYMTYDEYMDIYAYLDFEKYRKILTKFPDIRVRILCHSLAFSKRFFYVLNHYRGV